MSDHGVDRDFQNIYYHYEEENTDCTWMEEANTVGIRQLWKQKLLLDYTIKVEKQTFHAHKLVLASGSEYFRILLTQKFKECKEDFVELEGVSATTMESLLIFLYTSKIVIDFDNCPDILAGAMFLQITPAVDLCCKFLKEHINMENFLDIFAMARMYNLRSLEQKVMEYVEFKGLHIFKTEKYTQIKVDDWVPFHIGWTGTEWDLFMSIRNWIKVNPEERIKHLNTVMLGVRFALMTPSELQNISEMTIYKDSIDSEWAERLRGAMEYHKLPIWEKVCNQSDQSSLRPAPRPVAFTTNRDNDQVKCGSECFHWHGNGKGYTAWHHHSFPSPSLDHFQHASVAVVQNFLVCAGGFDPTVQSGTSKRCFIFDPRTMAWSRIADMNCGRMQFPLIVYKEKLYALGGCIGDPKIKEAMVTSRCEVYDFKTNSWTETVRLPMAMRKHVACVYKDCIYVSSKYRETNPEVIDGRCHKVPNQFECFDFSCEQWQSKKPMQKGESFLQLFPMNIREMEMIIAVGSKSASEYYEIASDRWFRFCAGVPPDEDKEVPSYSRIISDGHKTIYYLDSCFAVQGQLRPSVKCGTLELDSRDPFLDQYCDTYSLGPSFPGRKRIQLCAFLSFPHYEASHVQT